jgi:tetratricopeptide (TPR) repeat protein
MKVKLFKSALLTAAALALAVPGVAQVGSIQGKVTDGDELVVGALIKLERQGVKGNYQVKTKKKGTYFHAGLPNGDYTVTLEVDGEVLEKIIGYRVTLGGDKPLNFDLAKLRTRHETAQQSGPTGDALAGMSAAEKKKYEEALKKRQQQLSKNKELNEAFNGGMEAKRNKDYAGAVTLLSKASTIDPEQDVVWANLAEAQSGLAGTKRGDEAKQLYTSSIESYTQATTLQPTNAAYFNNMGLTYVKAGMVEEGKTTLAKAAEMDPVNGAKYYFNLGAVLTNSGNLDGAVDAFRGATEKDPTYAAAYYQLGVSLVGKAEMKDDGSIQPVPGTVEAFEKYLELEPAGANAPGAQSMIQSLSGSVETSYSDPTKKKKKS